VSCLGLLEYNHLFSEDDTRSYINTIQHPDDEHIMLETCRGLWQTYCKI